MTVTSCIDVFNERLCYLVKKVKNNSHETSYVPFRFVFGFGSLCPGVWTPSVMDTMYVTHDLFMKS